jgi:hypothetical protein
MADFRKLCKRSKAAKHGTELRLTPGATRTSCRVVTLLHEQSASGGRSKNTRHASHVGGIATRRTHYPHLARGLLTWIPSRGRQRPSNIRPPPGLLSRSMCRCRDCPALLRPGPPVAAMQRSDIFFCAPPLAPIWALWWQQSTKRKRTPWAVGAVKFVIQRLGVRAARQLLPPQASSGPAHCF